jgi:hypothetical protein
MRYPNESLEEYRARKLKPVDPPETVSLEFTGETEVLAPLAYWNGPAKSEPGPTKIQSAWHWFSWFHRSLAMGGALALVSFLVGTGLYLAIYGPPAEPDLDIAMVAPEQSPYDTLKSDEEPPSSDFFAGNDLVSDSDPINVPAPRATRTSYRYRGNRIAYRTKHLVREPLRPQLWVSQFVPTTLIIYVENGEIKSRIEPQSNINFRKAMLSN